MFTPEENQNLNEELIEEEQTEVNPKRGSKDEIIQKIYDLSDKANIPIEESLTKLKRKSKSTLNKLLAELVEKSVEKSIANKLGMPEDEAHNETCRNVALLRMMHDTLCCTVEKLSEPYLNRYNLTLAGYNDSLKNPTLSDQIDLCLEEIAQDCDVLEYVKSPYARLTLIHLAGLSTCLKKKTFTNIKSENVTPV